MEKNERPSLTIIVCALILATCPAALAKIIYVDDDANGLGNGSSWQNAYKYLQDALAVAKAGDEVQVAQGVYRPDRSSAKPQGTKDRNASFRISSGVAVLGGYAGLAVVDPNQRNVQAYQTILSGDLAGDDVQVKDPCDLLRASSRFENSYNVVTIDSVSGIRMDGLKVTGGYANASLRDIVPPTAQGGGIHGEDSNDVSIHWCTFADNYAGDEGGGLWVAGCANVTMVECICVGNHAGHYAGLVIGRSTVALQGCKINDNYARGSAGGMGASLSTITMTRCELNGNRAGAGGAARIGNCVWTMIACTIKDNQANWGAGIVINGWSETEHYDFRNCSFLGNRATTNGGALFISTRKSVDLANCVLSGNRANKGGAIYVEAGEDLNIVNCTACQNRATDGSFLRCKSGLRKYTGSVSISNSIVWDGMTEIATDDATISISYSTMSGGTGSVIDPSHNVTWKSSNLDVDPCFADPGHWDAGGTPDDPTDDFFVPGDYHLKSQAGRWESDSKSWVRDNVGSPCIDTGDPNSPIGEEPFPNGGRINMGAYGGTAEASKSYFGGPVCETIVAGDINGDCKVDFADLDILALHWLKEGGSSAIMNYSKEK